MAQVAVCATVLGGSALLVRAMQQSRNIDPGFRWESMIVVSPNLTSDGLTDDSMSAFSNCPASKRSPNPRWFPGAKENIITL